jgi:G3E family GTPase
MMKSMKIHLVGGFTGSGKTTAIHNACSILKYKKITSSFIQDEQADFIPDSNPVKKMGAPFARMTGGCSCCNYNRLDMQIEKLRKESNPSVIFAEYSGTCTNLISSLLKPLKEYKGEKFEAVNFSTFVDAELLLLHLQGEPIPLSFEHKYIWEKQIEEAEILVVNKTDLLSECEMEALELFVKDHFPSKQVLFQDSFDLYSLEKNWLEVIGRPKEIKANDKVQSKDSDPEAGLAMLDEEIEIITTDGSAVERAYIFMTSLAEDLVQRMLSVAHFQFFLSYNGQSSNISYTALLDKNAFAANAFDKSNSVDLLINARVHTSPRELRKIFFEELNQFKSLEGATVKEKFLSYFQP